MQKQLRAVVGLTLIVATGSHADLFPEHVRDQCFAVYDRNRDGALSGQELYSPVIWSTWHLADRNGDGQVTQREYNAFYRPAVDIIGECNITVREAASTPRSLRR